VFSCSFFDKSFKEKGLEMRVRTSSVLEYVFWIVIFAGIMAGIVYSAHETRHGFTDKYGLDGTFVKIVLFLGFAFGAPFATLVRTFRKG